MVRAVALARESARVTARSMPSTPRSDDESMMNEWRRWDDSTRLGSRFSVLRYIESKSRSSRHVPFVRFDAEDFLNFLSFFSFFFLSASGVSSALFDLGSNACLSFDPALRLTESNLLERPEAP